MHIVCAGPLAEAVDRGLVNTTTIDAAVRRVLNHKFSAGLFDEPYVHCQLNCLVATDAHVDKNDAFVSKYCSASRYIDESVAPKLLDSGELRELAYRTAVESSVLLRNTAPPGPNHDAARTRSTGACSRNAQVCFPMHDETSEMAGVVW